MIDTLLTIGAFGAVIVIPWGIWAFRVTIIHDLRLASRLVRRRR